MKTTLSESLVLGVHTNIPFVMAMLSHPEFVDGSMTTQFVGKHFTQENGIGLPLRERTELENLFEKKATEMALAASHSSGGVPQGSSAHALRQPWLGNGWRNV